MLRTVTWLVARRTSQRLSIPLSPSNERDVTRCKGDEPPCTSAAASRLSGMQARADFDDRYAILAAKTQYQVAYNSADLDRLLDVFTAEFVDCTDGEPTFYGAEAARALRMRSEELFRRFRVEMVVVVIDVAIKAEFACDWGWPKVRLIDRWPCV